MNLRSKPANMKQTLLPLMIFVVLITSCNNRQNNEAETPPKMNFIIIYSDELQFSDLGCYGGEIPTPNIDRLAAQGILFRSAYTTASMCTPSRYSVITGQFPGRCSAGSFLRSNPTTEPYNIAWNCWVTREKRTLPRILSENGYVTGMAGKWHIGEIPEGEVVPQFESGESLDDPGVNERLQQQQAAFQKIVQEAGGFDNTHSVVWSNYDSHQLEALSFHNFPWVARGALDFLDQQGDSGKPFFLYVAPTAVHGPNHREDLNRDVTYTPGGRDLSVPDYQLDVKELISEMGAGNGIDRHRYSGMAQTDFLVGQLVKKLEEKGLSNHTAIIFMADHNIEPGKATSFEKGVHIPLVIYWPGMATGQKSDALVQNTDLYPTLLEAAGIPLPEDYPLDGVSMLPVLKDPEVSAREWIFTENGYTRSVSDGKYKYIALRYPQSQVEQMRNGSMDHVPSYVKAWPQAHSAIAMQFHPAYFDQDQLYDLEADPYEQTNIYAEMAGSGVIKEMKQALAAHLATFEHPFSLDPDPFLDSDSYRKLTGSNLSFDIYTIPWLSRDHGEMVWPPRTE